jgi:hypothetical protein
VDVQSAKRGKRRHRKWQILHEQSTLHSNATIDPAHLQRICTAVQETAQVASIATVKAAIADTVDGAEFYQWMWDKNEENANAVRGEFMDAIVRRITQLQAAPLLYDAALLAKLSDARAEYHRGYSNGWEDAMADRGEMRRLAREGKR